MQYAVAGPKLECDLWGGSKSIGVIVETLVGPGGISASGLIRSPETLELLGLALNEVLHSINEFAGEQCEDDASRVEMWVESTLCIFTVSFRGHPLPDWLLTNWDRAQDPAVLAPPTEVGWGWLLVREALDSVTHSWADGQQILFLERRL